MTEPKYCPPIFSGILLACLEDKCHAWDSEHKQCLLRAYLNGYMKQLLVTQKMMYLYDDLRDKLNKEE